MGGRRKSVDRVSVTRRRPTQQQALRDGGSGFDPDYELLRVRSARMSDEARRMLEGESAARVFAIE